jgi:hypothetical protein
LDTWSYQQFGRSAYKALRHFSKSFEEALEMLGMSLLWFLFIRHLAVAAANLHVRFLPGRPTAATDEPRLA